MAELGTQRLESVRVVDPARTIAILNLKSDPDSPYWDWSPERLEGAEPSRVFLEWRPRSAPIATPFAWLKDRYGLFFGYGGGDTNYYGPDTLTLRVGLCPGSDWQMLSWLSGGSPPDPDEHDAFWEDCGNVHWILNR